MPTFQFRLERVLAWYRKKCRIEESRLSDRLAALRHVETRIAQFQAERLTIEGDLLGRNQIAASHFASLGRYRLRAKEQAAELNEERRRTEASVTEQRVRTQRAQRQVKLVEKLRERRAAEYLAAADRELETLAAEVHLVKWKPGSRPS
jgi:hypothetical protein